MKIATLTLNPTIDRTMYFDLQIKVGGLNRAADSSVTTMGGKGTNVACMLKILGKDSVSFGLNGGENGRVFMNLIEPYGITTDFTPMECETRMNIKIIAPGGSATEFNEPGGIVTPDEKSALIQKLKSVLPQIDLFFIGGSVPRGIDKSIYSDILALPESKNVKFAVDCDGDALRMCMDGKNKPYIIKPNQFEIEQYCGKTFDFDSDYDSAYNSLAHSLTDIYNSSNTLILTTLAHHGAVCSTHEGVFARKSPKVELRGFTGAGDTALAAFSSVILGYLDLPSLGLNLHGSLSQSALDFAVAASSAKVTLAGTALPSLDLVKQFYRAFN